MPLFLLGLLIPMAVSSAQTIAKVEKDKLILDNGTVKRVLMYDREAKGFFTTDYILYTKGQNPKNSSPAGKRSHFWRTGFRNLHWKWIAAGLPAGRAGTWNPCTRLKGSMGAMVQK